MKQWTAFFLFLAGAWAADLRVGLIGTDTSHATAFTRILNDPAAPGHVSGAQVVVAYKGGSPDLADSANRVEKFAEELRVKWKVEFVSEIRDMCGKVDALLLESVDGRKHLPQAREAFRCGKPVFIDKPLASTLEDARAIARLTREAGVPWFSTSSLRYASFLSQVKRQEVRGAVVWGPGPYEEHHYLDLSWYGIHAVEMLYTVLGTGCEEVTRISGPEGDVVVGRWKDGRTGTVQLRRPHGDYGAVVFRAAGALQSTEPIDVDYAPMLALIVEFFRTGTPPVPNEETLELFAFLDAAQRSKEAGGKPTRLR